MDLIDELIHEGWLKTPRIIAAFRKIKRRDFLPTEAKNLAEENHALSIGYGQTISQPLVVAFMLELLAPKEGDKILDIGSGSGWTTALLAELVGEKGKVYAVEIIAELQKFGEANVAGYNFVKKKRAEFFCADGAKGLASKALFDKILVSAAVQDKIPSAWKEQLKINGRLVTSVRSSIILMIKKSTTEFITHEYHGFAFVPLVEKRK